MEANREECRICVVFFYTPLCCSTNREARPILPQIKEHLEDVTSTVCGECWELISTSTNPWIHHKCDTVGCSEGTITNKTIA